MSPAQIAMDSYRPKHWMRPLTTWRELTPNCSYQQCTHRAPFWNGVFGHTQGVRTNQGWFCSPSCFEQSLADALFTFLRREQTPARPANRLPIGLLLMSRDELSQDELKQALQMHRQTGMRVGDCIRKLGCVSEAAITSAIAAQWACPVFPTASVDPALATMVPRVLLEKYRMLPVHLGSSGKRLFIGFSDGVDYSALYGLEQLLGCQTEPCIISSSTFNDVLEHQQDRDPGTDVVIESRASAAEIARMTTEYARQVEAHEVRYAPVGEYVWVRLHGLRSRLNLLYHRHPHQS